MEIDPLSGRPRNLPFTAEYGSDLYKAHESVVTLLETKTDAKRRAWTLKHRTAGYEIAGSCGRWTVETWSATYRDSRSNTTHGRRFADETKARAFWESLSC